MNNKIRHPGRPQRGFALVMAMIMLVIITLLAISSMRGTSLQTRMAGNMFDRGLAFQTSETALISAQDAIASTQGQSLSTLLTTLNALDCTSSTVTCSSDPFASTSSNWTWNTVGDTYAVNAEMQVATAQYHVDYMGARTASVTSSSADLTAASANSSQYGAELSEATSTTRVYRVTVRNAPTATSGRAEVMLQSTVEVKE